MTPNSHLREAESLIEQATKSMNARDRVPNGYPEQVVALETEVHLLVALANAHVAIAQAIQNSPEGTVEVLYSSVPQGQRNKVEYTAPDEPQDTDELDS